MEECLIRSRSTILRILTFHGDFWECDRLAGIWEQFIETTLLVVSRENVPYATAGTITRWVVNEFSNCSRWNDRPYNETALFQIEIVLTSTDHRNVPRIPFPFLLFSSSFLFPPLLPQYPTIRWLLVLRLLSRFYDDIFFFLSFARSEKQERREIFAIRICFFFSLFGRLIGRGSRCMEY